MDSLFPVGLLTVGILLCGGVILMGILILVYVVTRRSSEDSTPAPVPSPPPTPPLPKTRASASPVLMTQPDDLAEPDSHDVPGEAATQLGLQPPLEIVDTIWRLVVTSEPGAGKSYPLQGQVRVGRDTDNDITLPDDKRASRHHALFQITDNTLHIFDLNSSNGVYVDDKRIRGSSRLRSGNLVKIGKTIFVVQYDG